MNLVQHYNTFNGLKLDDNAKIKYRKGRRDGTITDTARDIIRIVLEQEVVNYSSSVGSYTFDVSALVKLEEW